MDLKGAKVFIDGKDVGTITGIEVDEVIEKSEHIINIGATIAQPSEVTFTLKFE